MKRRKFLSSIAAGSALALLGKIDGVNPIQVMRDETNLSFNSPKPIPYLGWKEFGDIMRNQSVSNPYGYIIMHHGKIIEQVTYENSINEYIKS